MRRGRLLLGAAAALVAVRLALPFALEWWVERVLDGTEGYSGRVGDVDLALLRGAYRVEEVAIWKQEGDLPVPLFAARAIDLSVLWSSLLQGRLVGEIALDRPVVNFVAGPDAAATQTGEEANWWERVQALFPLELGRVEVADGEVWYRDYHAEPRVDVRLERVDAVARNLTNRRERAAGRPATVQVRASAFGQGHLEARLRIDPFADAPDFLLEGTLENLPLVRLNEVFRAYGRFDVQEGRLDVVTEVRAQGGGFEGYVKPLIQDLDVLHLGDEGGHPLGLLWDAVVGAFGEVLENQPEDQIAARIPLAGSFEEPHIGGWRAFGSLLRNAYVEALRPHLERVFARRLALRPRDGDGTALATP